MTQSKVEFPPGGLVKARGREWIVLPESSEDLLMVRPIGGTDEEITAILPDIEEIIPATFSTPDPSKPGDHYACRLLRDAARLSTRAAAGPFRSFGRIAVEPRPYQLVPLLMALRLDPVRLLVADDVGIGKTIEACLIARELIDRGEVTSMAILCPPHLAEQWQRELSSKFHIDAELVLSSTIQRLERTIRSNAESVFKRYPFVIVSMDFIKQPRHCDEFLRDCPDLVIVDEAHGCTISGQVGKARQQRFNLLRQIATKPNQHLVLVTATPHSGNEDAFRSLISLIDPDFADLPRDLGDNDKSVIRRNLALHLVQRRRADIKEYLGTDTTFPTRMDGEITYQLTPEYKKLFAKVLAFAREMVQDKSGNRRQHRVRWWSALALLRAMASSPAAAAATLQNRAATAEAETDGDADEMGRRIVLDETEGDAAEIPDFTPGGDAADDLPEAGVRAKLLGFAREAQALFGTKDAKLQKVVDIVKDLIAKGHNPILFCRFIDTADYVAQHLREALKRLNVEVESVTGSLPPKDREDRISGFNPQQPHVLVCTDCLSEGINLQDDFDAIVHYDLSWNPTRHEQREGRVDRFGQVKPEVRVVTYFGKDNQIDGVVLDVLLRKHKKIKSDLGISVAVPGNTEDVVQALMEGMLLRGGDDDFQLSLSEDWIKPQREDLHAKWDDAREKERKSRSRFAQHSIRTEEVQAELQAVRDAIGTGPATKQFIENVFHLAGVPVVKKPKDRIQVNINGEVPRTFRHAIGKEEPFIARFDLPVGEDEIYLSRTHPVTEAIASWVLETALDEVEGAEQKVIARRCGATRTNAVKEKTTLLLTRFRYQLISRTADGDKPLLAEEIRALAFTGSPSAPAWLSDAVTDSLLTAEPSGNVIPSMAKQQLESLISQLPALEPQLNTVAQSRAKDVLAAHTRVRHTTRLKGPTRIEPLLPVDLLGCFILLPGN